MKIFTKLICLLVVLSIVICFAGCEDSRNSNPTIESTQTEPSTGGDFLSPPTYSVSIDHNALPFTLAEKITPAELALYKNIVKTYLNFGNAVKFDETVKYGVVLKLIEAYFPVIYCDTDGAVVNIENNTIGWTYTVKTKAEHDKAVNDFTKKAEAFLTGLRYDDSDTEVAMVVYERLYKNLEFKEILPTEEDTEEPEEPTEENTEEDTEETTEPEPEPEPVLPNSPFSPLYHKKGDGEMLTKAYCYLLTQLGIDSIDLYCDYLGELGPTKFHFMAVKLENKWYYSDPAEGVKNDSFTRFAFDQTVLDGFGFSAPVNTIFSSFTEETLDTIIICDSNRFYDLTSGANKVELDTMNNTLLFETDIGEKWNFTRLHG